MKRSQVEQEKERHDAELIEINEQTMAEQEALRTLEEKKIAIIREQKKCQVSFHLSSSCDFITPTLTHVKAAHNELNSRSKQLQRRRETWAKNLREMRDVQESEIRFVAEINV